MNSNLPVKKRDGIFYKIFQKIKQIFRKNKYKTEKVESNEVISNSNKQFKNDIKIDNEKEKFYIGISISDVCFFSCVSE